jgi:hypothetical protein
LVRYSRVETMGEGTLRRSICLQLLLIAAAIQGATPDAQDLASTKPLWLLCRLVASPDTLSDDDQLPDDVCKPMSAEMDVVTRHQADSAGTVILERLVTEPLLAACQSALARPSADRRSSLLGDGLIYTLCRLLC